MRKDVLYKINKRGNRLTVYDNSHKNEVDHFEINEIVLFDVGEYGGNIGQIIKFTPGWASDYKGYLGSVNIIMKQPTGRIRRRPIDDIIKMTEPSKRLEKYFKTLQLTDSLGTPVTIESYFRRYGEEM